MATTVTDPIEITPDSWIEDFLFTWINRFSFFLAHHLTRPLLPLYLVSFGASSIIIGAVVAVFAIAATVARVPVGLFIDRMGRKPFLMYGIAFFTASNFSYLWAFLVPEPKTVLSDEKIAHWTEAIAVPWP